MTAPTVTITDNLPGIVNRTTSGVTYNFDFSEPVTGLMASDFLILNCSIGAVSGSGANWQVSVTPYQGVQLSSMGLQLKAGSVMNAAGETNAVATDTAQLIDTRVAPPKLVTDASFRFLVDPQVTLQTRLGTVVIELDPTHAPVTVANMLAYVNDAYYDGTLFHRVIKNFMVQGGGFTPGLVPRTPTYDAIVLESNKGLSNLRGTIAMARTDVADSATSQFFINHVDNLFLNYSNAANPGYAVFGRVTAGLSVIDSLAQVAVTNVGANGNVPVSDEVITSIRQSVAGSCLNNSGFIQVGAIETYATWDYSLDGGKTWRQGAGSRIALTEGIYAAGSIAVRQTDLAGNASATVGILTSDLRVDTTAPALLSSRPADEAGGVAPTRNLELVFSEAVEHGSGSIVLKTVAGVEVERFDVSTSPRLQWAGNTLTVNPTANLAEGTDFSLVFSSGMVQDLAGNAFAGLSSYNFKTLVYPTAPVSGKAIDVLAYTWKEHKLLADVAVSATGLPQVTASDGSARLLEASTAVLDLQLSRSIPLVEQEAVNAAVNLQDAIAILKMVVGLNVNPVNQALSPYQSLAADFDGNGRVELNDAIGVLKHVVGLRGTGTPEPVWRFANESSPAVAAITADPLVPGVSQAISVDLTDTRTVLPVGLVAYLSGDVDGNFDGPAGSLDLDTEQPDYFLSLSNAQGLSLSQFGVYA
jgi:cyclophilin family peptidyl-prolyl cis-trans isomerase/methionine-rich copper-binding protein CopC